MKVEGDRLELGRLLWVQYGGVAAETREETLVLKPQEGDEAPWVKVFNPFGRLLRLYIYEDGHWSDAATGGAPQPFDEREAGHLQG